MRIEWACDQCDSSVEDENGWITIDLGAVDMYARAKNEWEREHPGPIVPLGELVGMPLRIPWHVYHLGCDPDPDRAAYWFGVERCRTIRQLMDWWLQLSQKNWFLATDWETLVRHRVMPQLVDDMESA